MDRANGPKTGIASELERLAHLHQQGTISAEEFARARRLALKGSTSRMERLLETSKGVLYERLLSVVLVVTGLGTAIETEIARLVVGGTTFIALFVYILPLSLAVAVVATTVVKSAGWGAGYVYLTVIALAICIQIQNVIPGARRVVPVDPTCRGSYIGERPFGDTQQLCSLHPNFSPVGALEYIVTVLYGYIVVFGIGLFAVAIVTGLAVPLTVNLLSQLSQSRNSTPSVVSTHPVTEPIGTASDPVVLKEPVVPDPGFRREGDDLYAEVNVSMALLELGGEIDVPTLNGQVTMRIPAASRNGRTLRLRGQGMHRLKEQGRGDLYVKLNAVLPTT